jgi:hypothetical protein
MSGWQSRRSRRRWNVSADIPELQKYAFRPL